jgi:hypothetical protein
MPPVGFEPTISAGERPQNYTLDRAATGTVQGYYVGQPESSSRMDHPKWIQMMNLIQFWTFDQVNLFQNGGKLAIFYILLTVHLDVILVNNQPDTLFLMCLFHAPKCFEQQVLIIRRAKFY